MKKFAIIAATVALAACGQDATEAPEAETAEMATTAPEATAGTFQVTDADGAVLELVVNDDLTYTYGDEAGTAVLDGNRACYYPETDGDETSCWTNNEPGPDGSFTSTSDAGDTVTVVAGAAS